jgi:hypothetical protein
VVSVFCRLFTQKPAFVNEVENLHIEKYMTDRMVYVIASQVGYHVMCTFLFERGIHIQFGTKFIIAFCEVFKDRSILLRKMPSCVMQFV